MKRKPSRRSPSTARNVACPSSPRANTSASVRRSTSTISAGWRHGGSAKSARRATAVSTKSRSSARAGRTTTAPDGTSPPSARRGCVTGRTASSLRVQAHVPVVERGCHQDPDQDSDEQLHLRRTRGEAARRQAEHDARARLARGDAARLAAVGDIEAEQRQDHQQDAEAAAAPDEAALTEVAVEPELRVRSLRRVEEQRERGAAEEQADAGADVPRRAPAIDEQLALQGAFGGRGVGHRE